MRGMLLSHSGLPGKSCARKNRNSPSLLCWSRTLPSYFSRSSSRSLCFVLDTVFLLMPPFFSFFLEKNQIIVLHCADRLHSRFVSLPSKTSPEGFLRRENLCASFLLLPRRDIRPWVLVACMDAVPPLHKSSDVMSC